MMDTIAYIESPDVELRAKIWNVSIPLQIDLNLEDVIGTEKPRSLMVDRLIRY